MTTRPAKAVHSKPKPATNSVPWSPQWDIPQARRHYAFKHWGEGFYQVDEQGHIRVHTAEQSAPLSAIVEQAQQQGHSLPLLLRFPQILEQRLAAMRQAMADAAQRHAYTGAYLPIYPIKVNQQRAVVHTLSHAPGPVGLEVGSKAELIIGLNQARPGQTLICNGFKDDHYLKLALDGQQQGIKVRIVLDKASELTRLIQIAEQRQLQADIGIRIRLNAQADGHWQNSGGPNAKFGIDPAQLPALSQQLRDKGLSHWLRLLHIHIGSQISRLDDYSAPLAELIHHYRQLKAQGHPIDALDLGGGPAIDYQGEASSDYFSCNYRFTDYAQHITQTLAAAFTDSDQAPPDILTEAGRHMSAHHSVLITNIIESEAQSPAAETSHRALINLSLFQSLPDIWGLGQIFPTLPLQGLQQPPNISVQLDDLTCDSDGSIHAFPRLGQHDHRLQLNERALKPGQPLAIFLTGAYQEALGDPHNLFGRPAVVQVRLTTPHPHIQTEQTPQSIDELLQTLGYPPKQRPKDKQQHSYLKLDSAAQTTPSP